MKRFVDKKSEDAIKRLLNRVGKKLQVRSEKTTKATEKAIGKMKSRF